MNTTYAQLGEVAEFINGVAFKPEDWEPGGLRIIRIQNLTDVTKPYNRTNRKVHPKYHVQFGDLLVSWSASLGVFEWNDRESALVNQHIFRVLPNEQLVDRRYLRYGLEGALNKMSGHLHGATMQHVNRGEFLSTKIPLPPLPEQRRIAAILDHADALRAKRRAAIAKLDSLAQSIFLDMFGDPVRNSKGWPIERLGDLFSKTRAGTRCGPFGSSLKKEDYIESGIPVLGIDDVLPNLFVQRTTLFISEQKYNQLRSFDVIQGDILISRAGTVGRLCVVDEPVGASIIGTNLIRLSLDESAICPEYFAALFTFFAHRFTGLRANAKADAYSFMSTGVLKSLEIPVPDVSTQRLFVDQQRRIKESSVKLEQHYSRLTELTQQLSIRAFQGTL